MDHVAVFSGLGSDALFADRFTSRVASDASTIAGQILLSSCYEVFVEELLSTTHGSSSFQVSDFPDAQHLINPLSAFQSKSVIQHSTLCLAHLLRHLHLMYTMSSSTPGCKHVTGLCAGLLPAVAVATSSTLVGFLSQARKAYRLALLVGLASDRYNEASPIQASAMYVEGVMFSELLALVEEHRKHIDEPLYISSKLSRTSFMLSGTISGLEDFKDKRLVDKRVKLANIASFYHNETMLAEVYQSVMDQYKSRSLDFPSCAELQASIISPADGTIINAYSENSLLGLVLSWIFLQPVDWAAVDATLSSLGQSSTTGRNATQVNNYGPGYGAGRASEWGPGAPIIRDVTFIDALETKPREKPALSGDIAIIGMAAQLPDADDCEEFWVNLENQKNSCREIPKSRFDYRDFQVGSNQDRKGRTLSTKWGNFLQNPFGFDTSFFGVSPREALSMDPQQRLMLKVAHRALESSGYAPDSTKTFAKETFACYIAVATSDYVENLREDIDVYYLPGTHRAFLSGKISYFYSWSGPSMTVDTVCSSSMTAINQAVRALQAGDCHSALVGGVNTITSPDMYIGLDRAHFLSPSGQCKSFDAAADGYCRAEGCGAVVLKRLEDALEENDQILGIIKSSELAQSGNAHSITHPHSPTQQKLLQRLLLRANTNSGDVSAIEAHGTGTQAGDPHELNSIVKAFCSQRTADNPLYVTSHKANIGHTEAASGLIATIKMCLMFQHSRIPPQALLTTLNPTISGLEEHNTVIPRKAVNWGRKDGHRRLGVINNFGAAGSIGAVLLEEPPNFHSGCEPLTDKENAYLLCISAKTESSLRLLQDHVLRHLATISSASALRDFCYTLTARRMTFQRRLIATGRSTGEIQDNLRKAQCVDIPKTAAKIVFVFSGQGSQYFSMGRALMSSFKSFHEHVMSCHRLLQHWHKPSCMDIIMANADSKVDNQDPAQIQAFQSAIFVLEVGLARLLLSWGIKPLALAGHSLGEYAALVISEVLTLEDGLRLVSVRAQLLTDHCPPGSNGMLAINMAESTVNQLLTDKWQGSGLSVACDNNDNSCVVGGPNEQLLALSTELRSTGTRCTLLDIPFAYHTEHVGNIASELTALVQKMTLHPAKFPILLNADGAVLGTGERVLSAEYFAQHCGQKVRFREGITDLRSKLPQIEDACWIEVGPQASVLPMVRPQVDDLHAIFVPSLEKNLHPSVTIARALQKIAERGVDISWRKYYEDMTVGPRLAQAPGMPFQEVEYAVHYVENKQFENLAVAAPGPAAVEDELLPYQFLSRVVQTPSQNRNARAMYETDIGVIDAYISGHKVCGLPLCPASVFHELALAATSHAFGPPSKGQCMVVEEVAFSKPFVVSSDCSKVAVTEVTQVDEAAQTFRFEVLSKELKSAKRTAHCSGIVKMHSSAKITARTDRLLAESEKIKSRLESSTSQILSKRTIYNQIFSRVVGYSELYQSIVRLKVNAAADEGIAECTTPSTTISSPEKGRFVADPVLMDTLLHTGGFLCNMTAHHDEVFIANSVEEACLFRCDFEPDFEVRSSNISLKGGSVVISDTIAIDSKGVIAIIRGLHFQKLQLSRMSTALAHVMEDEALHGQDNGNPALSRPIRAIAGPPVKYTPTTLSSLPPVDRPMRHVAASPRTVNRAVVDLEDTIFEIIAKARDAPKSSIKAAMSLDDLGIDSLLMLEMEASFRKIGSNNFNTIEFEKCLTVGDIVQLVQPAEASGCSEVAAVPVEEADELSRTSRASSTASIDIQQAVMDVISKACNIPAPNISPSMSMDELGIDSLMMLEMEKSFRQIGSNQFTAVDFERCVSVGDIIDLIQSMESDGTPETSVDEDEWKPAMSALAPHSSLIPARALVTPPVGSSELSSVIMEAIALSCRVDMSQIMPTVELDDLGIDSLMMLELEDRFHQISQQGFETTDLKDCRTVNDVINLVSGGTLFQIDGATMESARATMPTPAHSLPAHEPETQLHSDIGNSRGSKNNDPTRRKRIPMDEQTEKLLIERLGLSQQPEVLQSAPPNAEQKPAIFLIHAGSGFSRPYYRLSSLVGRNIWAIHDDKLLKQEESWHSVAHVAQTYADFVRKTVKDQPVIISGWSFGGIIAYEVTKLLQREGKVHVPGLLLVDPPPPNGYSNPRVAELLQRLFAKMFGVDSARPNALGNTLHKIAASNAIRCADLLETYVPTRAGKAPKTAFLYATDPVTTEFLAEEGDDHAPYDAWLCERENRDLALGGWFELLGKDMKIIDLPGNHYNILERDKVKTTSAAYIEACGWIENSDE